ncbi:hypothetical protein [Thermococcus sp.]|uniref:hypothetical protein n=1 Tax=Thermococcus sp. TaxID=35749 RepID=UPI0026026D43|nr:hypothetical protein [Thermococcus sp.]
MLPYLLFAFLIGITKGTVLLILGLIGILVSVLMPKTLMKKIELLTFVASLVCLRAVYLVDNLTPLCLLLALLIPLGYVAVALRSVEATKAFLAGLFVFAVVSTITSGSYVPTVVITAPALLGLLTLYGIGTARGDKRCTGKA